jgi:hypothetical protein
MGASRGDAIHGFPRNPTFGTVTADSIVLSDPVGVSGTYTTKDFFFTSQGIGAGTYHIAGFYNAPTADSNLTEASATQTLGAANVPYAAHVFLVAAAAGVAAGGAGAVEIEVSGTSITDAGVRTTSDTEVIAADITAMSTDAYYETTKKWIGQVTYTLQNASGSTQTTFSSDFNYGFAKYEDFGNRDFTVTEFEATGLAGATDGAFDVELLYHSSAGWTYHATAFVPGATAIYDFAVINSTESDLDANLPFAMKKTNLSTAVTGTGLEGVIIRITTGVNNTIEHMTAHVGVTLS